MPQFANAMEVFTLLERSNCRECGEKTCLAFAGRVFKGERPLADCPRLPEELRQGATEKTNATSEQESQLLEAIRRMVTEATRQDFAETASRIGGRVREGELQLLVLGKKFGLKKDGRFATELHAVPWLVYPLLHYINSCKGVPVNGDWRSFRELAGGRELYALFQKRGEEVLKKLADHYPDFFAEIVSLFSGEEVPSEFAADISVVLRPLPLVPVMICYWQAEETMESSLNLYFDRSVDHNLGADALFYLGTGIARMLEKLAEHHAF